MRKSITLFFLVAVIGLATCQSSIVEKLKSSLLKTTVTKDTVRANKDTVRTEKLKLKFPGLTNAE